MELLKQQPCGAAPSESLQSEPGEEGSGEVEKPRCPQATHAKHDTHATHACTLETGFRMAHVRRFEEIPMSKAMRVICKEEDYAFLNELEAPHIQLRGAELRETERREQREERVRRREERDKKEQERLSELEKVKKGKEERWKEHIAQLASKREATIRERAVRLRDFRNFQKKVLEEELGADRGLVQD